MKKLVDLYRVDNFIDTFALGHYARVLEAQDRRNGQTVALKVMRPEHLSSGDEPRWEYRAFANEADLLMKVADSPHTVNMLDCGYLSAEHEAPVGGEIESFGRDVIGFTRAMDDFCERDWRPYLALENLPRGENLFYQMRPDKSGLRLRLPTEEGLALALQFAETLKLAHRMNIAYLDHKLEHLYWDGIHLRIIDFNSSRVVDGSPAESAQVFCMDVHNLCVGILYSIFTGLSPQKTTLRPQPGSVNDVEARYQDVNSLDFGVEPTLSPALQELLQKGAARQITSIQDFIDGLHHVASLHGWDFPSSYTSPISRDARTQMRAGITRMRKGQDYLREARDLFREAAIQDGITDDLEAELRRLVKSVNEMLQSRVIP
jgi:serine/threonine protein kinase